MDSNKRRDANKEIELEQDHQHHHQMQQNQLHHHYHHHQQHQQNNQISFGMMQSSSSSSPMPASFNISNDSNTYDLGELDQALFLYLDGQDHSSVEHKQNSGMRPPTLNIFPSQPMHVEPSKPSSTGSEPSMELSNPKSDVASVSGQAKAVKREGNRKGPTSSSDQEGPKTPDPKTLRRLAQNREAARKSRLRKKAYVQQLESSRVRLTQLEQELQRARSQGLFLGGNASLGGDQGIPLGMTNMNSETATLFDMEYTRWLEEHHRLTMELRNAVQDHLPENELRIFVDNCLAHYDQVFSLKGMVAKSDVFHIISGMWKTSAERCLMWMGGFRPSEVIKIIVRQQIEALSEQQVVAICGMQQASDEAEETLSQGLHSLTASLSETIASDSLTSPPDMNTYMPHMALAINKLSTLEAFLRQADTLRHQTLHRLHQILSTRQSAQCFLAIAEYFHRLRALSSLWMARPRPE